MSPSRSFRPKQAAATSAAKRLIRRAGAGLPVEAKDQIRSVVRRAAIAAHVEPVAESRVEHAEEHHAAPLPPPLPPPTQVASSGVFPDFSHYLHALRTAELVRLPRATSCLLSAGPSSAEYFTWVEENSGTVPLHIGVEAYRPEPENLPANARWVRNSIRDLSDIGTASCDVMFSGQNFEHLWPSEVVGSLVEAHRVLDVGGYLVMDSPNRLITHPYDWSHPEHTIEFSPAEAINLLTAAGFDVVGMRGLHLCRNLRTGEMLPLDPLLGTPQELVERVQLAVDHPDESFVWWVTARCSERPPDLAALTSLANSLFDELWPLRMARVQVWDGLETLADGTVRVPAGHVGPVRYGPYSPLPPGTHHAMFKVRAAGDEPVDVLIDVVAETGTETLFEQRITVEPSSGWVEVQAPLHLNDTKFAVEFRIHATGGAAFEFARAASVDLELPD